MGFTFFVQDGVSGFIYGDILFNGKYTFNQSIYAVANETNFI